jgi:hypothetical protein
MALGCLLLKTRLIQSLRRRSAALPFSATEAGKDHFINPLATPFA